MFWENLVKKRGGDIDLYRINKHLLYDASWNMKQSIMMDVGEEAILCAIDRDRPDIKRHLRDAIKTYLKRNPDEHHPSFDALLKEGVCL
jgi:hypothetical protein